VRIRDNRDVFIKRVPKSSTEGTTIAYLSRPTLRAESSNHTVPLLDIIEGNDEYDFLVMPLLRFFDDPPFRVMFVDEVLDFVQQSLEGLVFLHRVGVAHRDCSVLNIMFDATAMYPDGFHPSRQYAKRSGRGLVQNRFNRGDVLPSIRYYFTDYGISSLFQVGDPSQPRLVTGRHCQDKTVPELYFDEPYDPFRTDVYILGNVYKKCLLGKYTNLSFLKPLVYEMTKMGPRTRPTAKESLSHFRYMVRQQWQVSLRWMLLESDMTRSERVRRGLSSLVREIRRFAKEFIVSPGASLVLVLSIAVAFIVSLARESFHQRP